MVITIIILLILATVSIATLTGDNGILTQAINAKEETRAESVTITTSLEGHEVNGIKQRSMKNS